MFELLIVAFFLSIGAIFTSIITLISKSYPVGQERRYKKFTKRLLMVGIGMLIVSSLFLLLKMY